MSEVDDRPEFIKRHEVGKGTLTYEGELFLYTLLDQSLEPALPGFVGYYDGKHLYISNDVPADFREPQLVYEITKHAKLNGEMSYWQALDLEIDHVPENKLRDYLNFRLNFFKALAVYYEEKKLATEEFMNEISKVSSYLNVFVANG